MRGRSGEGRRSGATEREADIDILSWRGRCESGHEHQGKHNGRGRGTKKGRVGADVGSRTDEAGAGGGHTTGEREAGVCIHRVEGGEGPAREFPAFAQLILIPPQRTPSF